MALELPKFGNKEKKPAGGGVKNDTFLKITEFFEKNPLLKIALPVLLFLIFAGIFAFIVFGDGVLLGDDDTITTDNPSSNTQQVDVLSPEGNNKVSDTDILALIKKDPLSPDILASAKYTGYTTGSSGLKTALVEVGNGDKLVLSLGDTVDESEWEVIEITSDYIVFKAGETTKKITK